MATGLGDPAAGIVQPNVSELVSVPAVEPRGTQTLTDAFRQGFITADDIISRIDHRAKAKKKAEEQIYREQLSPEAQEARAAVRAAEEVEAKARVEKAEMDLEERPYIKAIRRTEAARKIAENQTLGGIEKVSNVFSMLGIPMPLKQDPETGLTGPDIPRAYEQYAEAQRFLSFKESAKARIDQLKDQEFTVGKSKGQGVLDVTGRLDPAQARQLRNRLGNLMTLSFEQWRALNAPQSADVFSGQPGTVTTAAPAPAPTATTPAAPPPAPTTTTAAPAPAPAVEPAVGQMTQQGIVMTTIPGEGSEPGTEVQTRAKSALARFQQSNNMMDALTANGFDPTSVWTWSQSFFPEIAKSGDQKAWEAGKQAWSQGILRYESGAAISRHEQSWYEDTFFPRVGDPQWLVDAKAKLRNDMEQSIASVANAGGAATPETKAMAQQVMARAERLAGWSGRPGTRSPEQRGFQKVYRKDGSVLWKDPATNQFYEPDTGEAGPAPKTAPVAPAAGPAPAASAPVVEPRKPMGYVSRPEPAATPNWALESVADFIWPFRQLEKKIKRD